MTTPETQTLRAGTMAGALLLCVGLALSAAHAQPADDPASDADAAPAERVTPVESFDERGRRVVYGEPMPLAFKSARVENIIPFIVETTGKVVLPQPDVLSRPITVLNDRPIPRERALDLVFMALQQNGIAVVETPDLILLRDIGEIDRQDVPVIGPDTSLARRTDYGTIVEKVFALHYSSAETLGEVVKSNLPSFAKLTVDPLSNQIAVMAHIGLLQQIERKVEFLDQPSAASLLTETFHLRFADAEQVATNIRDLFSQTARTGNQQGGGGLQQFFQQQRGGQQGGRGGQQQGGRGGQQGGQDAGTSPSANLRVTANTQQNSVTVLAEKQILEQIKAQINDSWDRPVKEDTVAPRIYELKNSDPIKVRDALRELFGQPGSGGSNTAGVGRLAGQFSFEALPEQSRLIVLSKSPDNLSAIDELVLKLDTPQTAGLPRIVELKHATAEELAEQLNTLLSQEGTLAQIPRQETGLTQGNAGASPFASDQDTAATNQQNTGAGTMQFWWQRARPPTTTAGSSNLVSKIRLVPVWRQNALMVLSPPEYSQSIVDLITELDKPGRQVLLKAVIAEISLEDATALGLRWSNSPITPTLADNAVSLGANTAGQDAGGIFTGTQNNLLPGLFDTSILNVGVDLNLLLQALAQKTGVNILSEPRIFTSDNQEAEFFAGQDVPFITDSQTTDNGALTQSFDYRAVGLSLRVRPRITPKRDVDLRINLELSSLQPDQTLFGGFIVDRRETTTHLIVKDGQTVVVSGIVRSEDASINRKVPLLGDIPLIGALFQSVEKSTTTTEIVAFITPIVIENPEETDAATVEDRKRLAELREELGRKAPVDPDAEPDSADAPAPAGGKKSIEPRHGYEP
jgi:type II secretion system protein D